MIGIMTGTNSIHIQLFYQFQVIHHKFASLDVPQAVIMLMTVHAFYISRNTIHQ